MQIIARRFIAVRGLPNILAFARIENEQRINSLLDQKFNVKPIFHEKDFNKKDPIGLEVSLGDFRTDKADEKDLELKYSLSAKLPKELISDKTEYFLECREYAPQQTYNKVFCDIEGNELNEDFNFGKNYMAYLCRDQAVEVSIGNSDYVKIRRNWVDFSPQGDSVRICRKKIWKGPLFEFPRKHPKHSMYAATLERCLTNLQQKPAAAVIPSAAGTK